MTAILWLLLPLQLFAANSLEGFVKSCHDGDTCRIEINQKSVSVRLSGVDAPEKKQIGGRESQKFMQDRIVGRTVQLRCQGRSYKRRTCEIHLDGRDVGEELVRAGHAWDSPKYSKGRYRQAEEEARAEKRGLWAMSAPTSPYCFRWKDKEACRKNLSYMP